MVCNLFTECNICSPERDFTVRRVLLSGYIPIVCKTGEPFTYSRNGLYSLLMSRSIRISNLILISRNVKKVLSSFNHIWTENYLSFIKNIYFIFYKHERREFFPSSVLYLCKGLKKFEYKFFTQY